MFQAADADHEKLMQDLDLFMKVLKRRVPQLG